MHHIQHPNLPMRNERCVSTRALLYALSGVALAPQLALAQEFDWMPESSKPNTTTSNINSRSFFDIGIHRSRASDQQFIRGNLAFDDYRTGRFSDASAFTLSGRVDLDLAPQAGLSHRQLSLSLREAYVTQLWEPFSIDLGRITIRDGVAIAYNPSDVFRAGSLVVRRTEDPARLRESRLGVVALQVRTYGAYGQLAGLFAPGFTTNTGREWYNPQWAAVNGKDAQVYLRYTPPRWHGIYTNFIAHREISKGDTVALNLSRNLGQQSLLYLEWAKRFPTETVRALEPTSSAHPPSSYHQAAIGGSYTNSHRQSFSLEYQYNGAGLSRHEWRASWQNSSLDAITERFSRAAQSQDPLAKHSLTALIQWDQFSSTKDELSCLHRRSLIDHSHLSWCEWRYKQDQREWNLNLSKLQGVPKSEFGASSQSLTVGAKLRLFY